jgi:Signal transduction histidine kinase
MKLTLKSKLILSYVALSVFIISLFLFISNVFLQKQFQDYVMQKQEQTNQTYVQAVLNFLSSSSNANNSYLSDLGTSALNDGIILMVTDPKGKITYCVDTTSCRTMLDSMQATMEKYYPNSYGKYMEKTYLLKKDGVSYGELTIGYYGPYFYNETDIYYIDTLNKIFILGSLVIVLVACVIGYIMAKRISNPLKQLMNKTAQIEHGNYDIRMDAETTTKEIDELIGSVNSLANSLSTQQATKKRLATDYAHEFRTPLTALRSNLECMIDGIFEPTTSRLESMNEEILRLSRMVNEIDKITSIESETSLNKELFDFGVLLNQTLNTFERELFTKNIEIVIDGKSCDIYADRDKISQVLVNLLSNSIKYTEQNGMIAIEMHKHKKNFEFSIRDTGCGIEEKDLPFIFDHLYRTDESRNRSTGGSGIGLSVVKAIVTAHEGTIDVQSEVDEFTKFTIKIPL